MMSYAGVWRTLIRCGVALGNVIIMWGLLMKKVVILILAMVLLAGCSTRRQSGFLGDENQYDQLQEDPGMDNAKLWRKPGIGRLADHYDAVIVEPVQLWIPQEVIDNNDVTIEELQMLTKFFHDALVRELSKVTNVVQQPGPKVLRLELAITAVRDTPKVMNAVSSVLPVGVVISFTSKAVTGEHVNVGEVAIEAIARDSMNGEVLAKFSDVKTGNKYSAYNYERLGQAKNAIDEWAETMRKRVEESRDRRAKK